MNSSELVPLSLARLALYHSFTDGAANRPVRQPRAVWIRDGQERTASKAKAAAKADDSGIKIVARNRRARHDYELMEKVEAGIVLTGTEVKSLRNGKANLEDAYAEVDRRRGLAARAATSPSTSRPTG